MTPNVECTMVCGVLGSRKFDCILTATCFRVTFVFMARTIFMRLSPQCAALIQHIVPEGLTPHAPLFSSSVCIVCVRAKVAFVCFRVIGISSESQKKLKFVLTDALVHFVMLLLVIAVDFRLKIRFVSQLI